MERVHRACEQASSLSCPLTKTIVMDMIREHTGLTSVNALEETYLFFRKYYGWVWLRWERTQCLAPADVEHRIDVEAIGRIDVEASHRQKNCIVKMQFAATDLRSSVMGLLFSSME